ncbi:MAG: arylsulfotransferase family protein [Candidatus Eremiobacteraeota bacterium]|nr:arylsulfotransferase family protein [Candidatus Eremiobacteraeota bacterium]
MNTSLFQEKYIRVIFWIFVVFCGAAGLFFLFGGDLQDLDFSINLGQRPSPPDATVALSTPSLQPSDPPPPTAAPAATKAPRPSKSPQAHKSPQAVKTPRASKGPPPLKTPSTDQQAQEKRLLTLPYAVRVPVMKRDANKMGVVTHLKGKCQEGLNLYSSKTNGEAYLVDMDGNYLHKWGSGSFNEWENVEVEPDGDLYFLEVGIMLGKMDWDSRMLWTSDLQYHHWLSVAKNGDIYSIAWSPSEVEYKGVMVPILNDNIVILSPGGKVKKIISLYDSLGALIPEREFELILQMNAPAIPSSPADVFHSNFVQKIERTIPGLCKAGDILISSRQLNNVAILDPQKNRLKWRWGEKEVLNVHSPFLTEDNHLLLFDNGDRDRQYSRILEIDPLSRKIVYEYKSADPEEFFSTAGGAVQKLGNGNLLITETNRGKVFEITPRKKIVWEFFNPDIEGGRRSTLFRMTRLSPELSKKLMEKVKSSGGT